ncbi:MAG: uracil-DNA glycosylase [Aureliella sp.]
MDAMDASSELNTDMQANQLQRGLAQILQTYAGAGLKRFAREPGHALSPQALEQLAAWSSKSGVADDCARSAARSQAAVAAQPDVPPTVQPAAPPLAASPAAAAPLAVQPTTLPTQTPPVGLWQLPAFSLEERQSRMSEIDQQVRACRKCDELVCYRRQTVLGEGNLRPRVCFYGEAPGADEDRLGRPFVGAAGKLLTDIIRAMRLSREEVYIMNSLKCRPPQNRTPLPEEVENCRPYALAQLELLQPEFIILLGAVAVRSVLDTTEPVGRLRGRFHQFHGAKVLVTYHPAYLLRTPDAKKLVWADVQMVMRELGSLPSA